METKYFKESHFFQILIDVHKVCLLVNRMFTTKCLLLVSLIARQIGTGKRQVLYIAINCAAIL